MSLGYTFFIWLHVSIYSSFNFFFPSPALIVVLQTQSRYSSCLSGHSSSLKQGTSFACKTGLWGISFQSLFQTGFEGFRCFRAKWRGFIILLSKASGVWWYWPDVMGEACSRRGSGMSWRYNQPPSGLWWEKQMENRRNAALLSTEDEAVYIIDWMMISVSSTKRNKANERKKIYNNHIERLIFGFTFLFWPFRKSSLLDILEVNKTY